MFQFRILLTNFAYSTLFVIQISRSVNVHKGARILRSGNGRKIVCRQIGVKDDSQRERSSVSPHSLSLSLSLSLFLSFSPQVDETEEIHEVRLSVRYLYLATFLCNPCYVSIKNKELHRPSRWESEDGSVASASRKLLPPLTHFPFPSIPFRQFGFPLYLHSAVRKRFTFLLLSAGIRHVEDLYIKAAFFTSFQHLLS